MPILLLSLSIMPNKMPLVTTACLCEKVLSEKDGALSLIRIVDKYTVAGAPDVIERINPHLMITLVVALKGNGLTGKHEVGIQLHGPTKPSEPHKLEVEFPDKPLGGANLVWEVAVGVVKNFGEMRFDVTFDGEYLTTIPFTVLRAQG